ncbi:hypothetical protein ACFQGT_19005 [Natrialbaceae archaeon GCM10025810]|uniref:hypothetical protein n=1 Tax=Halovalidus salilacus TaxID=3075124 RepID=UPI00361AEDDD
MNRLHLALGIAAAAGGLATLFVLALDGVLGHPASAADAYRPRHYFALGAGFLLLTGGVVTTFTTFVSGALEAPARRGRNGR